MTCNKTFFVCYIMNKACYILMLVSKIFEYNLLPEQVQNRPDVRGSWKLFRSFNQFGKCKDSTLLH